MSAADGFLAANRYFGQCCKIVVGGSSPEIAVVGAGITGLAVARELTARGRRVVVLERSGIAAGASGVQPGGVRQQWGTRVACRLARESVAFWRDAAERLGSPQPLELRRSGYLFVARGPATLGRLERNVRLQNEEGVPSRIVSPAEAAELVPGLEEDGIAGGAWCEEDGYFDRPQAVVEAFARGLEIRLCTAEQLTPLDGGWRVESSTGRLDVDTVVVASGVDAVGLLGPLGVDLPISAEDRYLFLSPPERERLLEPLVVAPELGFAAKQLADGRVLASDLTAAGDEAEVRAHARPRIRAAVEALLPRLLYVSYALLVRGTYDVTPDHQPILGPADGLPGLYVAAGFSGHGFMIAPAVARIIADAVEQSRDETLDVLDLARFAEGRAVPEPQLV